MVVVTIFTLLFFVSFGHNVTVAVLGITNLTLANFLTCRVSGFLTS